LKQLVLDPGVDHFEASSKDKVFLMNKEEKLKDYHQKLFMQFFFYGICYLLNLPNGFQNPASC